ncbi:Vitamin B12 transport ATP-binding protein BacA [Andreprevotia sp. IGB-42]|uniref:ABC transporter ATP-binding protein/permease n=1 Tax=Andreprevotia sp. IGB-42 TaxID=2497473 RepID=UPI00135AA749|nr:ABC transporter ATP-binding protein/permease [Andreprevotia sp. IGB-42]KAF0812551.1 Vitamin B12 transport ATP-binding protein BacA [Andreprevotia sp. IGB-42]
MSEPTATRLSKQQLFKAFWHLTRPYWVGDEKWKGIGLLVLVVALNLAIVYMNVQFNSWYGVFYDALQKLDSVTFWQQMKHFAILAFFWIAIQVYALYFRQMLEIKWRRWLTEDFKQRWMQGQGYYRLQLTDRKTDNPDQRIAEDVGQFVSLTLGLSLGLMRSVVNLITFITILWALSGPLRFVLMGHNVVIPGYMVWAAILYTIVGTLVTIWIGKALVGLNFEQQRREANFRFALIRVRENAESIALYKGEGAERKQLSFRLGSVVENFWSIMRLNKRLTTFTSFWGQLAIIFPFLVAAPRLFAKEIQLGGLMQINNAFREVYDSLNFIMDSFSTLATWKAVIDRLSTFEDSLGEAAALPVLSPAPADHVQVSALGVNKPDGDVLIAGLDLSLQAGDRLLVQGASGSGKSTLLRTLAGIWPYASGNVAYPQDAGVLFLSQRPYLPLGSLREALSYPAETLADDEALRAVLAQVKLSQLADQLDVVKPWSHELSLGEQQRIAMARALLLKPRILVLDEATSAIDEAAESTLYQALIAALPSSTLISVGHRSSLKQFHNRFLDCHGDGNWSLA